MGKFAWDPHGLLDEDRNSFVFATRFPELHKMYKKIVDCRWTVENVDMSLDRKDFMKLSPEEKRVVMVNLSFFKGGDGVVIENAFRNFLALIMDSSARAFWCEQLGQETVHAEMYKILIETFADDREHAERLLRDIETFQSVLKKMKWAEKWLNDDVDFRARLLAFAVIEGVFFSSSFCSIFWFKKRGLMPGLAFSNQEISRDEALHVEFALMLYSYFDPLPEETVFEIFNSAIKVEHEYVREALPTNLRGINATAMCQYVNFVADRMLCSIGILRAPRVENPFDFMDLMSMPGKTHFFERRVGEYNDSSGSMNVHNGTHKLGSLIHLENF